MKPSPRQAPAPIEPTRVVKTLGPAQHGAIKLARRYGEALVCVRYRQGLDGQTRYTTVELIVDITTVQRRSLQLTDAELAPRGNARLRAIAMALGARWDPKTRLWHIPAQHAKLLCPGKSTQRVDQAHSPRRK